MIWYYDPSLSLWLGVDPLADKYPGMTPYNYVGNNPINAIDIKGDSITPLTKAVFFGLANQSETFFDNTKLELKLRLGLKAGAKYDGFSAGVGGEIASISFKNNYGKKYVSGSALSMDTKMSFMGAGMKAKFTTAYTDSDNEINFLKGSVNAGFMNGYNYELINQESKYSVSLGPATVSGEMNTKQFISESYNNFKNFLNDVVKSQLPNLPKFRFFNNDGDE